ncbi:MAG: RidA family protein [Candidatus Nanopelagicales bacterium]
MSVAQRLADLGLVLPEVPAPVAAYVPAVRSGAMIYTAGQLPFVSGELLRTGLVGDEVGVSDAVECARQCALNALAAVASQANLDEIRVVKVVGFVASAAGFTAQPQVLNGASELIGDVLGEKGVHARSAVGVAALPLNAPVEVEVIAEVL